MGALETNTTLIYGVHLRESANDGSDFSNAAADYRVLFLGEDGQLHVKDSSGTVTAIGSGIQPSEFGGKGRILVGTGSGTFDDLAAGTNGHVLTLDSGEATGVKWAAAAGGSGVSGKLPVNVGSNTQTSSASTLAVTITAATSGNVLFAEIASIGTTNVSSIASTNTTWTNMHTSTAGTSPKAEIWKGVVAGGSSGTTVTITWSGNNSDRAAVVSEWNGITGTLDQSAMRAGVAAGTNGYMNTSPAILPTNSNALVLGCMATTNGTVRFGPSAQFVGFEPFMLDTGNIRGYMGAYYAFPGTTPIALAAPGPSSGNFSSCIVSVT